MKRFLSIVCFLSVFVFLGQAYQLPCDFSLKIGADVNICGLEFVQMEAIVSDDPLEVQWEPAALFSNANTLTPVAAIPETTLLSVSVSFLSDVNLVVNGDFSLGDQDFVSDYIYGTGGGVGLLSNEGQYAIASNAGDTHNHFDDCTDHTGGGNMMVVNASGLPNSVWCQTITVTPNTEYEFGAWLTSVTSENPAQLQFSINGSALGDVLTASSTTCFWQEFTASWMSGAATTAEICINNVNLTPNGNDFAIDDISFKTICVLEDELTVNVGHADATWVPVADLCEGDTGFVLNDLLDVEATPGGSWTVDGALVDGVSPIALDAGGHEVTYTVTDGICEDISTQIISVNQLYSTGMPSNENPLVICEGMMGIFNLFDLLDEYDNGGSWTQSAGNAISGGILNSSTGDINFSNEAVGSYEFSYAFDLTTDCHTMPAAVYVEIAPLPVADAGVDKELTCMDNFVQLGSDATSTGSDFTYQWVDLGTMEVMGDEALLEVSEAGIYELQVTDTRTGCSSKDKVTVLSNVHELELTAHGEALGCANESNGQIIIDNITGGEAPYWLSLNGGEFMDVATISNLEAGDYSLTVMDITGCLVSLDVSIFYQDELIVELNNSLHQEEPSISLGDSIQLSVQTSLSEDEITNVVWLPMIPGCDSCFSTYVRPTALSNNIYTVTVFDENGCSATAGVEVFVKEAVDVFVPNAFSPNDDGVNDIFYVNAGASIAEIEFIRIVDRWGNLVFSRDHILPNSSDHGWDGNTSGRAQAAGVYTYILNLKLINGKSVTQTGSVVLVR